MGLRRILAPLAVLSCLARPAFAQQADAERPVTVYSDVLSGRGEFATVVLAARTAYRVEVTPGSATFSVRPFELGRRAPMVTSAFENPVEAGGGVTYLVVPAESGEYRIDVAADGPVRVRIVRDPREQALLEGRARTAWHMLTLGARYVALRGDIPMAPQDSVRDPAGWEACVGVVEGSIPFARRLHGCAFTFARLSLADGGWITLYGFAPRYRLLGNRTFAVDLSLDIGVVGKITLPDAYGTGGPARTFQSVAAGLNLRFRPAAGPVEFEVAPGYAWIERDGYGPLVLPSGENLYPAATTSLPRLAAGFGLRF